MYKNKALNLVRDSIDSGNVPRVHPNGFIQLDLDNTGKRRLHVWRNDLPRQKVHTPVHNHRFDFTSVTIAGSLINTTFDLLNPDQGSPHRIWQIKYADVSEETRLIPTTNLIGLVATNTTLMTAGTGYEFSAGSFHESAFVHNTVTMIKKSDPVPGIESEVLVPQGIEPDNTFTRSQASMESLRLKIIEALS